jgi:intein/homing endonuclease
MKLENYFDLLVDAKIDNITNSPICIEGIHNIINQIYLDLKDSIPLGKFQSILTTQFPITTFLHWKNGVYPIPIVKLKKLLGFWKLTCNKTTIEKNNIYNDCFSKSTYFRAMNAPNKIKIVKGLTPELSYFLGLLYADGSLRNIWLTFEKERRFRWEITITDEASCNLHNVLIYINNLFGIKTNVKKVYQGRWYRILFSNMILLRLLNQLFDMPLGFKKGKLRIPKIILNSSFEIKKNFVVGFFDGDGWVNKNPTSRTPTVELAQSSDAILQDISQILSEKNMVFRLNKKNANNYDYYTLTTKSKKNIKLFQEHFGFQHPHKVERLKNLVNAFN